MGKAKKAKDPNHLGFGRLMAWKSSDISAGWVNLIMLNYLSIYASDTLGIDIKVVGTLLLASKLVDAVTDVFAGWLVDNTHTKLGKARPYELAIVGMTICTIGLFACPENLATVAKCAWIFCMYTLTFSVFATLRTACVNPYTIRHFSNNVVLVRKVASYGSIITMAGSMVLSVAFPMLMKRIATTASGWTRLVTLIMIPATLIALFRFFLCKEDPSVDAKDEHVKISLKEIGTMFLRNKYCWLYAIIMLCYNICTNLAVGTYYFKWVVGNLDMMGIMSAASVILLPLMLVFPWVMKKLGSMGKMIAIFSVVGVIGYAIAFVAGSNVTLVLIGYLLGTFSTLPIAYYGALFVMNICTYNEMLGMARMDGSAGILANFATKCGGALGAYVTGALLALGGYVSESGVTSQSASAIMMIRVDFAIVPLILIAIIGTCALLFSRLEPIAAKYEAEHKAEAKAEQ